MDRSYPYSRRLVSRARLRKRMAAVAGAGVAAAVALFALGWDAGPISAGAQPQALPVLALADAAAAGDTGASGVRRIYPYSVVPGGVSGQVELARVVRTDRVVAAHYASFDVAKARPVVVEKPRAVHVSYRKGDKVYWTAGKVMLAPGETLLSDGRSEMRARCANRISDVPQYPVEDHRPAMEELDHPVEVEGGDDGQYALGPDGLPVSMDADGAIPRHAGQRFPAHGGYASNAAPGATPANAALSGSTHGSGGFDGGVLSAMGLSGSSSSMGSRPRPAGTPVATPPASTPGTGAAPDAGTDTIGGSAGSTEPGGIAPVPQPAPGTPAVTPQPGTDSSAPSTGSPSTGTQPQPGTTIPTDPVPSPLPGAELPAVLLPVLDVTPDEEPAGGGIPAAPVPPPPLDGPLFPQPGPNTEPFIPKPDLGPAPLPPGGAEQTTPPAGVPEPGSIWLGGLALAAMLGLRRRRA